MICVKQHDLLKGEINVIYRDDFDEKGLLNKLNLADSPLKSSFGISDTDEIERRQIILSELMTKGAPSEPELSGCSSASRIPTSDGADFLYHMREHVFWKSMEPVMESLAAVAKEGSELRRLVDFLKSTKGHQIKLEQKLFVGVSDVLKNVLEVSGIVEIIFNGSHLDRSDYNIKVKKLDVIGRHRFNYSASEEKPAPRWTEEVWSYVTGLRYVRRGINQLANKWRRWRKFRPTLITELPVELLRALVNGTKDIWQDCPRTRNTSDTIGIKVFFNLDGSGLRIEFLEASKYADGGELSMRSNSDRSTNVTTCDFLSTKKQRVLSEMRDVVYRSFAQREFNRIVTEFIQETCPDFATSGKSVPTNFLDKRLRYKYLDDVLFLRPELAKKLAEIQEYRAYMREHLDLLSKIAGVAKPLLDCSKKWKIPLSFPTILSGSEHRVAFSRLDPIHLIGYKEGDKTLGPSDLRPISSSISLNGQMVALSGQNAGGKTVIEESVVIALYLAQSGLPIFGSGLEFNPKKVIGLMFVERGAASMLDLMLSKADRIIEVANNTPPHQMIVILDELGSGTQQGSGRNVGRIILKKLHDSGCSVMFSTQITELVEDAKNDFQANTFGVDLEHRVTPGIRGGNVEALIRRRGYANLLN